MGKIARERVRVGRVDIPMDKAAAWIAEYTDVLANVGSEQPYAFPAYDRYDGGTADPATLTDGDLLAPVLFNVQVRSAPSTGCGASAGVLKPVWPPQHSTHLSRKPSSPTLPRQSGFCTACSTVKRHLGGVGGTTL